MAGPTPGEVYEKFADSLAEAETQAAGYNVAADHASSMVTAAMFFDAEIREKLSEADGNLNGHRNFVISAIEAAGSDIEARDIVEATMRVRGRSTEEIETFFEHIDRIEATDQPVAVISTQSDSSATKATVTYGNSRAPVSMPKDENDPRPQRAVSIPLHDPIGFRAVRGGYVPGVEVFARRGFKKTPVNINHPFDRIHFAASGDEVGETVERIVSADQRSGADHAAVNLLGVPTMVAYGAEAVREFADQVTAAEEGHLSKERLEILNERCLDGLDVEAVMLDDLIMRRDEQEVFEAALDEAIAKFLTYGGHNEQLAFLGPLQTSIGYESELVMQAIRNNIVARYLPGTAGYVEAAMLGVDPPSSVEDIVQKGIKGVANYGIEVAEDALETTSREIKEDALERALSELPRRKVLAKHRIKVGLSVLQPEA